MISATIDYPADLPNPLREGHSLQAVQSFTRTDLANGRARQRRGPSGAPVNGTWDFVFDDGQASLFEAWFHFKLKDGVEWFNIQRETPLGMRMLTCRFTSMYQGPVMQGASGKWRYSCPLEIFEREYMPEDWFILPGYWVNQGRSIFDVAMNREWPEA